MMRRIWFLLVVVVTAAVVSGIGEVGMAQEEPSVGDTASFYFFDFHFFTRYERTEMTLRGIGEHCYVWTQNSQWARGRYVDTTGVVTDSIVNPDSIRIDMEDVEAIIHAFDEETPAADDTATGVLNDTRGIYDKLTDLYGDPPDVDGDPRVFILIIDCTEAIGAAAFIGYFDPVNELTRIENEFSNEREVIYIDCDPFDPGTDGLRSAAQQFTHLLQYGNDPDEECWITDGLSYFSQFICGYGVNNEGRIFSREPLIFFVISVLTDCREEPEIQDQVKTAIFMQYLFEQYGIEVVKTLATDTKHTGTEAVTAALAANGHGDVDFDSVFVDEQLAWFMDSPQEEFYGGKYSFKYYQSGAMLDAKTFTYWGTLDNAPYFYPGNQWSADFITVIPRAPCLTDSTRACYSPYVVFNGDLEHDFQIVAMKTNSLYLLPFDAEQAMGPGLGLDFLTPDDRNRAVLDVSGYGTDYKTLFVTVIHKGAMDGSRSRTHFVIDNDMTSPDTLHIGVMQNPLSDRYLDIYVAANESLFVIDWTDQRPEVRIMREEEEDTLTLTEVEKFVVVPGTVSDTTWGNTVIYHVEHVLSGEGSFTITATGWDMAGNAAPGDAITGAMKVVSAQRGATLTSEDERISLVLPAGAFRKETCVTLFPVEPVPDRMGGSAKRALGSAGLLSPTGSGGESVGSVYQCGPAGPTLSQRASLTMRYAEEELGGLDASQLAIHRFDGSQWVAVDGELYRGRHEISARIDRLGQFQLRTRYAGAGVLVPEAFALFQNYPNPFNPTTEITYHLPVAQGAEHRTVVLKVYNVLGQEVRTLVQGWQNPGAYTVRWDGKDAAGRAMPSGVYFYRLTAVPFMETRRMVLLK